MQGLRLEHTSEILALWIYKVVLCYLVSPSLGTCVLLSLHRVSKDD